MFLFSINKTTEKSTIAALIVAEIFVSLLLYQNYLHTVFASAMHLAIPLLRIVS
jgi:hypothetical protein